MRIIVILILLAMALFLSGQEPESKTIHQDYGEWIVDAAKGQVGIAAYSTVELIEEIIIDDFQYSNAYAQKKLKEEPKRVVKYKYEIYLSSLSIYDGDSTGTWIYGLRIFGNGVELTEELYPDGFTEYVEIKPEVVFELETEVPENIDFEFKWRKAVYENRTHRKNN